MKMSVWKPLLTKVSAVKSQYPIKCNLFAAALTSGERIRVTNSFANYRHCGQVKYK